MRTWLNGTFGLFREGLIAARGGSWKEEWNGRIGRLGIAAFIVAVVLFALPFFLTDGGGT